MALLKHARLWFWLGCAACAASCEDSAALGRVDVWLSECRGAGECDAKGAASQHFAVQAFVDPSVSRYAPHGVYLYFELPRRDGSRGVLELDAPTDRARDQPLPELEASYRELAGDQLRFSAREVSGKLEVPRSLLEPEGAACACDDGGFSLRFAEAGSDGELGTDDDRVRLLSFGRFGRSDTSCSAAVPPAPHDGLMLDVPSCDAPASRITSARETGPNPTPAADTSPSRSSCYYNCYQTPVLYTSTPDDGCGSSSGNSGGGCDDSASDERTGESSGGCGSDASSSDSSGSASSSGGCSDSSSDDSNSSSSSGCEGDTKDDNRSSSCAVIRATPHGHGRRSASFVGTGLPLALICVLQALRAKRLRARARPINARGSVPRCRRFDRAGFRAPSRDRLT